MGCFFVYLNEGKAKCGFDDSHVTSHSLLVLVSGLQLFPGDLPATRTMSNVKNKMNQQQTGHKYIHKILEMRFGLYTSLHNI